MCVIALKYINELGWIGGKCRDRNYQPEINIKQSFKNGVERLLFWDSETKWTEGINQYGVAILNSTLMVKKDESEGTKSKPSKSIFYSPGGKNIRTALYEKSVKNALEKLIELETEGNTIVFSADEAYLLEGTFIHDQYIHKYIKCDKNKTYLRTNHGILIPGAGYPKNTDDEYMKLSRKSSEMRLKVVQDNIDSVDSVDNLFQALSQRPHKNYIFNPTRISDTVDNRVMHTTGQIVLCPKDLTLYYRPIWCKTKFDFDKINNQETQTFFEIVSSRKIFSNITETKLIPFTQFYLNTVKKNHKY